MDFRRLFSATTRLKIFLFFNFMANGVLNPYLGLFLFQNGLDGKQVALLLGVMPFAKIIAQPAWAVLCDRLHIHRLVLSLSLLALAVTGVFFLVADRFGLWIVLVVLFAVFEAPYTPLGSTISLDYLESIHKPDDFGNLRLWGSLGFVIASLLIGYVFIDHLLDRLPLLYAVLTLITSSLVWTLPKMTGARSVLDTRPTQKFHLSLAFVVFLAGMCFLGFTSGIANQYFVVYMNGIDARGWIIGLAVALMALSEIPLMAHAAQFIHNYGIKITLLAGMLAAPLRFLFYAVIKDPWWVLPVQLLQGITIVSVLVVGATFVARLIPPENRTLGQGLFSTAYSGIGMSLGLFSAGYIYDAFGISMVWTICALMGLIGALIVYCSFKLPPDQVR